MKHDKILFSIGLIEILIGTVTILATILSFVLDANVKTMNVLIFVLITGCMSALLGVGLLLRKKSAYELLIYFSSIIIFSKILIFANIISLNGALETSVPSDIKSVISVVYHGFVILFLRQKEVQKLF